MFTDFNYDNLGIPRNSSNPFYGQDKPSNPAGAKWADLGLGGYLEAVDRYKPFAAANLDPTEMGDLGLTETEEEAVVGFMKTLSDRPQVSR